MIITDFTLGPPDARPGACYGKDVTPAVIEQIRRVRKSGFTVAPEAGTDRLREVINKGITEDDLLAAGGEEEVPASSPAAVGVGANAWRTQ